MEAQVVQQVGPGERPQQDRTCTNRRAKTLKACSRECGWESHRLVVGSQRARKRSLRAENEKHSIEQRLASPKHHRRLPTMPGSSHCRHCQRHLSIMCSLPMELGSQGHLSLRPASPHLLYPIPGCTPLWVAHWWASLLLLLLVMHPPRSLRNMCVFCELWWLTRQQPLLVVSHWVSLPTHPPYINQRVLYVTSDNFCLPRKIEKTATRKHAECQQCRIWY